MNLQDFFEATLGQWELLLRLLIACICGFVIGVERSFRQKEAGIRTHIILALGAALMMIVSKYGFFDIAELGLNGLDADASRVASNIVTGISFLGAGVIFVRGGSIKGLTTAAGIWATAGIGMALGAGMYTVGVACTIGMIIIQLLLHKFMPFSENMETNIISIKINEDSQALDQITQQLTKAGMSVTGIRFKKQDNGITKAELTVRFSKKKTSMKAVLDFITNNDSVQEFTLET
ncbi:MAG: MgtC/SapB family protein [Clostridia bacterium]|nr:MgtC/SapB family protein [Clostridia bacterium]MBR6620314.1 MgtC/SapB family protein [Clostridia bacterium]